MDKFKAWMLLSSAEEKRRLARGARIPYTYLHRILSGARRPTSELAGRIEKSSERMRERGSALPILTRADISLVCNACPHYCGKK